MKKAHPKFYNDLKSLDLDIDVFNRLSQHLLRTEEGSNDILMTPIAKDHDPYVILSKFDKVFNSNRYKMNDVLIDLELSNKAKFGPRSEAKPWSDREKTLSNSFGVGNHDKQVSRLQSLSNVANLRPLSVDHAMKLLKNSTNSGLPYYTQKGKVKQRTLDKFEDLMKRKDPCILFTRTQEQGKTRNVWGYPMVDTLNEMKYYSPTLGFQKRLVYRAALVSPEQVSREITKLLKRCQSTRDTIMVAIDFTTYDDLVKFGIQKLCFDYIKSLFQKPYHDEIDSIFERFNTIGILTPSGIFSGSHGIPSGSTFTNEVGSVAQATVALNTGIVSVDDFQIQGDDGCYLVNSKDADRLIRAFEEVGLKVNETKSYRSNQYTIFLQNLYHIDYMKDGLIGGIYPIYRALNRILFQERWATFEDFGISGKDYYSIRSICIMENCKYHPLFREFVKFIYSLDKYSLDVSYHSISKYVQMLSTTEGAGEILKHQFGDDVGGIRSFETVKLIKELS